MRTVVLILTGIAVAAIAAEPQLVPVVRVPQANNRAVVNATASAVCISTPSIDPAAVWQPLIRMSLQERANAELAITANSPEVRAVEAMWNRGEYEAAIAALQHWAERADLRQVYVGFNWRVPLQSSAADWGTNVRVGMRDSTLHMAFDRENSTGNLMVASACLDGDQTDLVVDLSTDGGSTWAETHFGYWMGDSAVRDLEMVGSDGYEYVAFLLASTPDSAFCYRFDAVTGALTLMPDSTLYKAILQTSLPNDTLDQIAITSSDDQYPGMEIEVVGGTRQHMVEAGYSGNQGADWGRYTTFSLPIYWGGLDYCYNQYDSAGWNRYVMFSYIYWDGSHYYPAYAFYDSTWHGFYIPTPTYCEGGTQTGIAARKDTVVLAYPHVTGTGVAVRCWFSYDAGLTFDYSYDLTDSAVPRENIAVCGRLGDGIGVVWRDYGGGDRWIVHRHSDYTGANWTEPDTVNDIFPDWADGPRIQRVAPGVEGVCYIGWSGSVFGGIMYTRSDWAGIAGPSPERIVPTGLVAAAHRGGARLSFTNPVAGLVALKVFDATGRLVLGRTKKLKPGPQTLDCAVPASGSYIAVLKTAAATATAKFSVLR